MGNLIPWSQIHPSITSQEPCVAVVIIDPQRQICVSEMVPFDLEALANPDVSAAEVIAAAQAAATKVAGGYRARRKQDPAPALPERLKRSPGTKAPLAWADGPRKRGRVQASSSTLSLPLEMGAERSGGLQVLDGGKD